MKPLMHSVVRRVRSCSCLLASMLALAAAERASCTVTNQTVADSYIVTVNGINYSVLDIYHRCGASTDSISSVFGVSAYVARWSMNSGKSFIQTGDSGWAPTNDDGSPIDSFVTAGCRNQGSDTTLAGGKTGFLNLRGDANFANFATPLASSIESVSSSAGAGWYPGVGANTTTNPYARAGFYNSAANRAKCTSTIAGNGLGAGGSLDNLWMIGRFVIVAGTVEGADTMTVQFAFAGKNNGVTSFTGATGGAYRIDKTLTFATTTAAPSGVSASDGSLTSEVAVNWSPVMGATGYRIMRSEGSGAAVEVGTTSDTAFSDSTAVPGLLYGYSIYALNASGPSLPSASDSGWRRLAPPANVVASDGAPTGDVKVEWSPSWGATSYKVFRAPISDVPVQLGQVATTDFADSTGTPNQTYRYSVVASCALGDSDVSSFDTGFRILDCNRNGVDDSLDLDPPISITTGNMGTLVGATTRTATKNVSALSISTVTVSVDAIGDLDSTSEYLIVRLSNPPSNVSGIVRNVFVSDGLACPATPQRATFMLTKEEFNGLLGNAPGSLKIDVTPTAGVGGTDSTCQATSSVAVSIDYVSHNSTIDCNSNGVIDFCEIASGAATDCNSNGVPDSCEFAAGSATDLNHNGIPDGCELLVGSPAYPTIQSAVAVAPAGAIVPVLPGTYNGPVDLGGKGLILRSTGGKGLTTIRGASSSSALRIAGGGSIDGFTIEGGGGDAEAGVRRGGALRITSGTVTVKDCDLRGGDVGIAGEGGLVFISDAAPVFQNCQIESGTASLGGGVYAISTTGAVYVPVFDLCALRNSTATAGGGMLLRGEGMQPSLRQVRFEGNQASGVGGALAMLDGARPTLNGCKACGNTAVVVSGAYDVSGALSYLTDDCNGDGVCDADQIAAGQLTDLDADGIPDTCQDCDHDGYSDRDAIARAMVPDCDGNMVPDACDLAAGAPDCNGNGVPDVCDISGGLLSDCNRNGVPDGCELASGVAPDCNANGIPDACDITAGREEDQDGGGVPDACQYAVGDLDLDGATNNGDLAFILLLFDSPGPIGDLDRDGIVGAADVSLLLLYFE